ncbi:MAG: helix-turn-helix domain-containing protein [Arenibacterium sp.]
MARDSLTGTRIRERRLTKGMRQAELARHIGISASYLNLIEHNRRRIGGKLLVDISAALDVEPSMLTEGAAAALVTILREAAVDVGPISGETDRAEDFASRFPGWAEVLARKQRRVAALERTVETLSDRLSHDPNLAGSLHEVLSTATAIRSVASILAETKELDQDWRDRFHKNLNADSLRLAESSKALMAYLDDSASEDDFRRVPREEAEAFLSARGHHFPEIEEERVTPQEVVAEATGLGSGAARDIAVRILEQYRDDARALPLDQFAPEVRRTGGDPDALVRVFKGDYALILRRLAGMPEAVLSPGFGLVMTDAAGGILFRKSAAGFVMPRSGAPCPLWPVFVALGRPLVPLRRRVTQLGRGSGAFDCVAWAAPVDVPEPGEDPVYQALMLIRPATETRAIPGDTPLALGSSCRVCPKPGCRARREPSILREGF